MALTGSFSGSIRDGKYTLRVDWNATQNVADNTSTITCNHYLVIASNYWVDVNSRSNSTVIDGASIGWTSPAVDRGGSTVHLGSVSRTVAHNGDGTKSLSISATYNIQMSAGGTYWSSINASTSVTLDTIPRTSKPTLSTSTPTMGTAFTIYTNRASTAFTHTLTYHFGTRTGTIATGVTSSASWTIPEAFADQIPNNSQGIGRIYCKTYSGGTLIGEESVGFTASVPIGMCPSLTYTIAEAGGITLGVYVQGKSRVKIALTSYGVYGSTIRSYSIQANGTTYTSSTATTGYLGTAGSNTITMRATDSRGRTTTKTASINVVAYSAPWVNTLTANRCREDGTADDQGAYAKVSTSGGITAISGNARALRIEYRKTGASGYTRKDIDLTAYTWNTSVILPNIDIDSSWEIRAVATDTFGSTVKAVSLSTAAVTVDYRAGGKGVAFGKVAEYDRTVEIAPEWKLRMTGRDFVPYQASVIPDYTDLNDLVIDGDYCCTSNSSAGTISNCPSARAFYLKVRHNGTMVMHDLQLYDNASRYYRTYYDWSDTWVPWSTYFPSDASFARECHSAVLINGAENLDGNADSDFSMRYTRTGRVVSIHGIIDKWPAADRNMFVLPEGFRPAWRVFPTIMVQDYAGRNKQLYTSTIYEDGGVRMSYGCPACTDGSNWLMYDATFIAK